MTPEPDTWIRARFDSAALREWLCKTWPRLLLPAALVLAAVVHWPLLDRFFQYDDFLHLYHAATDRFLEFVLRTHGGHLLGVWRGVFWVKKAAFGLRAELWFAVVIATHLLNVCLLYGAIRCFTGRIALAGYASALWGISPLARGSLGWLSVYPHVLLTTWVLWALYDVARVARGELQPTAWTVLRWLLLMLLAVNSFGIGLGVAMAFPFACALLFWTSDARWKLVLPLLVLLVAVPAQYLYLSSPDPSLVKQALAEPMAESDWRYLLGPLPLLAKLTAYALSAVAVGPLLVVSASADPSVIAGPLAGTSLESARLLIALVAVGVVGVTIALLRRADAPMRRDATAFVLLALACYAPVAVGRWYLVGNVDAWMWPRYHYLGPALVLLAICRLLPAWPQGWGWLRGGPAVGVVVWLGLATFWSLQAAPRVAPSPGLERRRFERAVHGIQTEILEVPVGRTAYLPNRRYSLRMKLPKGSFPGWAGLFVIMHAQNDLEGRRVRFVEPDEEVRSAARTTGGERIRELLVSPVQVPPEDRRRPGPDPSAGRPGAR